MDNFKLDRSAFKRQTHQQSSHNLAYWLSLSINERLKAAIYLNSICFGVNLLNPPHIDKTHFKIKKRKNDIIS